MKIVPECSTRCLEEGHHRTPRTLDRNPLRRHTLHLSAAWNQARRKNILPRRKLRPKVRFADSEWAFVASGVNMLPVTECWSGGNALNETRRDRPRGFAEGVDSKGRELWHRQVGDLPGINPANYEVLATAERTPPPLAVEDGSAGGRCGTRTRIVGLRTCGVTTRAFPIRIGVQLALTCGLQPSRPGKNLGGIRIADGAASLEWQQSVQRISPSM
jgi:hypothetical protein